MAGCGIGSSLAVLEVWVHAGGGGEEPGAEVIGGEGGVARGFRIVLRSQDIGGGEGGDGAGEGEEGVAVGGEGGWEVVGFGVEVIGRGGGVGAADRGDGDGLGVEEGVGGGEDAVVVDGGDVGMDGVEVGLGGLDAGFGAEQGGGAEEGEGGADAEGAAGWRGVGHGVLALASRHGSQSDYFVSVSTCLRLGAGFSSNAFKHICD